MIGFRHRSSLRCTARWIVLAWAVVCTSAVGQDAPPQQAANAQPGSQPSERFTLSGTVVNAVTGDVIPHALVELPGTGRAVLTGLDGRFEFDDLPQTETSLTARKPGFFNQDELNPGGVSSAPLMVEPGAQAPPVVLKLTPQSVISGKIESSGNPVEGVTVRLFGAQVMQGHKRLVMRETTTSNEDGEYRIAHLTPGTYYLQAGPALEPGVELDDQPGSPAQPDTGEEGYAGAFYPGVAEISAASPIDLGPGDQTIADLDLKSAPVVRISGVIAGSVQGHEWLQLNGESRDDLPVPMRLDEASGKFLIKAPAGSYRLRAGEQGQNGANWTADTTVEASKDISGLRLVLAPQPAIPVSVSMESSGTAPARTRGVTMFEGTRRITSPPVTVHLVPVSASPGAPDYFSAPGGENGELAIHGVQPGAYAVEFGPSAPWHVDSAVCGDVDLLQDNLTVTAGSSTPPIQIVLHDDGAALRGTVSSEGEPVTGAVVLVPQRAPRQAAVTMHYAGTQFEFANLAPGEYSVFAVKGADRLEYSNPDVLQPYLAKATRVTLQPGGRSTVNLELLQPGN